MKYQVLFDESKAFGKSWRLHSLLCIMRYSITKTIDKLNYIQDDFFKGPRNKKYHSQKAVRQCCSMHFCSCITFMTQKFRDVLPICSGTKHFSRMRFLPIPSPIFCILWFLECLLLALINISMVSTTELIMVSKLLLNFNPKS
jgi:hypothetical protein